MPMQSWHLAVASMACSFKTLSIWLKSQAILDTIQTAHLHDRESLHDNAYESGIFGTCINRNMKEVGFPQAKDRGIHVRVFSLGVQGRNYGGGVVK